MAANGSGVAQALGFDVDCEDPVDEPADVEGGAGVLPDEVGGAAPGGSQPPLTQVPPPKVVNGSGELQVLTLGEGAEGGEGGEGIDADVSAGPRVVSDPPTVELVATT